MLLPGDEEFGVLVFVYLSEPEGKAVSCILRYLRAQNATFLFASEGDQVSKAT